MDPNDRLWKCRAIEVSPGQGGTDSKQPMRYTAEVIQIARAVLTHWKNGYPGLTVNLCRLRCRHHAGLRSYRFQIGLDDLCLGCLGASDAVADVMEECPALIQEREAAGVWACLEL